MPYRHQLLWHAIAQPLNQEWDIRLSKLSYSLKVFQQIFPSSMRLIIVILDNYAIIPRVFVDWGWKLIIQLVLYSYYLFAPFLRVNLGMNNFLCEIAQLVIRWRFLI